MSDIRNVCKQLRLAYIADIYEGIEWTDHTEYVTALLQKELALREQAKAQRLISKRQRNPTLQSTSSYGIMKYILEGVGYNV